MIINQDISVFVGGLPKEKMYCSVLGKLPPITDKLRAMSPFWNAESKSCGRGQR